MENLVERVLLLPSHVHTTLNRLPKLWLACHKLIQRKVTDTGALDIAILYS